MHPIVRLVVVLAVIVVLIVLYGRIFGRRDQEVARGREFVGVTESVRARISRELTAGHKIQAVKTYREATGAPLVDAKRAIDGWFVPGSGQGVQDAAASWTEGRLTPEARSRISELIRDGRREDAMSLYAEATGASDSEAQAIIRTWDTTQDY